MVYFYNKIIILEVVKSRRGRLTFIYTFALEAGIFMLKTFIFSEYANYSNVILSIIVTFGFISFFMFNLIFLLSLYKLNNLNK